MVLAFYHLFAKSFLNCPKLSRPKNLPHDGSATAAVAAHECIVYSFNDDFEP